MIKDYIRWNCCYWEKKNTWKLTKFPKWQNVIDLNWMYKINLKKNCEADKYKTCMVSKSYK
jgi:hypothetical protein